MVANAAYTIAIPRAALSSLITPSDSTGAARQPRRRRGTDPKHLGALAEALAGKVTRAVRDALAARRRASSWTAYESFPEQLDSQYVRIAGGAELFPRAPAP